MISEMKAIFGFFSQFGVPAYAENGIPPDAVLPYLTYSAVVTSWEDDTVMAVRVWSKSTSYAEVAGIVDRISKAIGESATVPVDGGGYVYMYKGSPWAQIQPMQDTDIKVAYLNVGISTMTE